MEEVTIIGVDLAKNVFQLHDAADANASPTGPCGANPILHMRKLCFLLVAEVRFGC